MSINTADWMGQALLHNSGVRQIPMCQFPLPGSHDAGSYGGINVKSKTQHFSIYEQLEHGVRYFDFRVRVDRGVFFSHHGPDESRDNPYTANSIQTGTTYLFGEITRFLRAHIGEVVVLNFKDFTAVTGQDFTATDAADFMACLLRDFGAVPSQNDLLYVPGDIPTYGRCIDLGQRIILLINDEAWPGEWSNWALPTSTTLRERFSDYKYALHSWNTLVDDTLADQQNYLADTGSDGRDPGLFWVSQAVLGYTNMTTPNGGSQNKEGASHLNPVFETAYGQWWAGTSAIPGVTQNVQRPNVLLLDYSGFYDDFATICYNLIT